MLDILLWPFVVGTPKGSVAACHAVSRAMAGQVWLEGPSGHAWPANLAGSIPGHLLSYRPFLQKNDHFCSGTSIFAEKRGVFDPHPRASL